MKLGSSAAVGEVHLSHGERSDRIARCDLGEGFRSLIGVAAPHPICPER